MYLPEVKYLFYYDLAIFIFVFFILMLANFSRRSFKFNLSIAGQFLLKALVGGYWRHLKSYIKFRQYFVIRLGVDIILILPTIIWFQIFSKTFIYNYFIVIITVVVSELALFIKYISLFYTKSSLEQIETLLTPYDQRQFELITLYNMRSKCIMLMINTA